MFNFKPISCPICGQLQPVFRVPKTWRQFWRGGHTCANCKTQMDKWGKVIKDSK